MASDPGTALLLVDIQTDFCEGGALAVPDSLAILPVANDWIGLARKEGWPIVASRDWHPVDHCSFQHRDGDWPAHCIQDTEGAAFHPQLQLPDDAVRVSKGTAFEQDAYSAFDGTQLEVYLKRQGIERLYVGGLALDVCVQATVKDACQLGFETIVLADATRAVEPDQAQAVFDCLERAGALIEAA